jgi:hypothetical protein
VFERYRPAFRLIVGCDFSPAVWWKVFAPIKVPGLSLDPARAFTTVVRQLQKRLARRDVPESRLQGDSKYKSRTGIVEGKKDDEDEVDYFEKVEDIFRLTDLGYTPEAIADLVECPVSAVTTVQERRPELETVLKSTP